MTKWHNVMEIRRKVKHSVTSVSSNTKKRFVVSSYTIPSLLHLQIAKNNLEKALTKCTFNIAQAGDVNAKYGESEFEIERHDRHQIHNVHDADHELPSKMFS